MNIWQFHSNCEEIYEIVSIVGQLVTPVPASSTNFIKQLTHCVPDETATIFVAYFTIPFAMNNFLFVYAYFVFEAIHT